MKTGECMRNERHGHPSDSQDRGRWRWCINNTANTDLYDNLSDVIILNDDVVLMSSEDIEEHINDIINLQKELLETKIWKNQK